MGLVSRRACYTGQTNFHVCNHFQFLVVYGDIVDYCQTCLSSFQAKAFSMGYRLFELFACRPQDARPPLPGLSAPGDRLVGLGQTVESVANQLFFFQFFCSIVTKLHLSISSCTSCQKNWHISLIKIQFISSSHQSDIPLPHPNSPTMWINKFPLPHQTLPLLHIQIKIHLYLIKILLQIKSIFCPLHFLHQLPPPPCAIQSNRINFDIPSQSQDTKFDHHLLSFHSLIP